MNQIEGGAAADQPAGPESACLVVICGPEPGRRIGLSDSAVLGRSAQADIQIDDTSISRRHARLHRSRGRLLIRDLASTNGTYVNECAVSERVLSHGDLIRVGKAVFRLLCKGDLDRAYREEVHRLAILDGLTQAANRPHFMEVLGREIARANRYRRPISLVLFEPAHYPVLRSRYGELAMDALLRQLGTVVQGKIRGEDLLGRLGEARFGVLLPEAHSEAARCCAHKLSGLVQGTPFAFSGTSIPIELAISARSWNEGQSPGDFLGRAMTELDGVIGHPEKGS